MEITHDAKVTKEIVKIGEGKRLRMGYIAIIKDKAYHLHDLINWKFVLLYYSFSKILKNWNFYIMQFYLESVILVSFIVNLLEPSNKKNFYSPIS